MNKHYEGRRVCRRGRWGCNRCENARQQDVGMQPLACTPSLTPQPTSTHTTQQRTRIFSSGTCAVWFSHSFMPTIWNRSASKTDGAEEVG